MVIAFHSTIHDDLIPLLSDPFSGYINVDPVRIPPHARVYLPKLNGRAGVIHDCVSEVGIKVAIVEEDIWIVEPSVEMSFQGFDGLYYPF